MPEEKNAGQDEATQNESLDLTTEQTSDGPSSPGSGELKRQRYDSRPAEDKARKNIAYTLIALLAFVIVSIIVGVMACWLDKEEATTLLQLILSPVVALVSAATGFYYGTKSGSGNG